MLSFIIVFKLEVYTNTASGQAILLLTPMLNQGGLKRIATVLMPAWLKHTLDEVFDRMRKVQPSRYSLWERPSAKLDSSSTIALTSSTELAMVCRIEAWAIEIFSRVSTV